MTTLEFRCRHRHADGFEINADFQTASGVVSIFGPSGSGKTTLLDMIAGLRVPQSGLIRLGDQTLFDSEQRINLAPEKRGIGFVFQDLLLFPHLTVKENLLFSRKRRHAEDQTISFERVVEVLELGSLLARKPDRLSGGERQRVALGRALLSRPRLLLLDEPLVALDERLKQRILSYIERIHQEWSIQTIFVSHSQAEVRRLAQWVVVLQSGRRVAEGAPEEALALPDSLAMTEATGPMNLLRLEELREADGRRQGRVGDQWITLPASEANPPRFVSFPPDAAMLAPHDVTGLSARNHLRARVVRTVEVASAIFVELDAGQRVWAVITAEAAREMNIVPGMQLLCLLKTQSIRVT